MLRKYFFRQILFIAALITICACSKEDEYGYLRVNCTDIQMSSDGGNVSCSIESNVGWSISADENYDWLQISPMNGTGNGTIHFSASPNSSASLRIAYIKILSSRLDVGGAGLHIIQSGSNDNTGGGNDNTGGGDSSSLGAPTNVSAKVNGSSVSISWNAVTGATKYNVYRNTSSTGKFSLITTVSGTSATDSNPLSGSNYYKVTAANGNTESDYSSTASVSISKKPATPTGLRAVQSGTAINVSWNAVSGAEYYKLYYKRPAPYDIESFQNIYSTSANMEWNTMVAGTYTFWVVAVSSDYTTSDASSKVTCNFTNSGGGNTGGGNSQSKLDTPQNIEAYSGGSFVQISFDEVSLAYQYELYRSTSATYGYTKISASGGSTSSKRYVLTDSNPKSGTTYYKVKAVALSYLGIADSDFSAYVKVTR
ncbi:MAG: hypothetical protein K2O17_08985 [Bacteroidaceae bacterium]|nr:hypothetical protein [Bacteroidaceae bacterium]